MRVPKPILIALAAALGGLLLAGSLLSAAASPAVLAPGAVNVPEQRTGDALRYELAWSYDGEAHLTDVLVRVEGARRASDMYGIERSVETTTVAIREQDGDADYRCSFLAGTSALERRDLVAGAHLSEFHGRWSGLPLMDTYTRQSTAAFNLTVAFDDPCAGRHALGGRTLREADELTLSEALGGLVDIRAFAGALAAGERVEWEGRDALRFVFAEDEARVVATWAEGIPGVVQIEAQGVGVHAERGRYDATAQEPVTITLRGIERGAGDPLASAEGALPPRHPSAAFVPTSPLLVDDAPFAPTYPFADAIAALRTDPATCAREMLARPDAIVWRAEWDKDARDYLAQDAPTLGGWTMDIVAEEDACEAYTVRLSPHPLLPPVTRSYDNAGPVPVIEPADRAFVLPATTLDAAGIAALATIGGVDPGDARNVVWTLTTRAGEPTLIIRIAELSTDPRATGQYASIAIDLDATRGGLDAILSAEHDVRASPTPLGDPPGMPSFEASLLGALGGPSRGQGLAIAGLAALAILVKFLFLPLYSRLRRATLLDNPVRARLYDAVRRDPGIHRAALIEYAGVGVGATTRHLRQLAAHRYLVEIRDGGFVRYYAAGEVPPDVARREGVLRAGSQRAVYDLYAREPHVTLREAGARLGMSAPSVHRAKRRLEEEGLLPVATQARVVEA